MSAEDVVVDPAWMHDHLGTIFRTKGGDELMLVSVDTFKPGIPLLRFRTRLGELWKAVPEDVVRELKAGNLEEAPDVFPWG